MCLIQKISEEPCSNWEPIRHTVLWEGPLLIPTLTNHGQSCDTPPSFWEHTPPSFWEHTSKTSFFGSKEGLNTISGLYGPPWGHKNSQICDVGGVVNMEQTCESQTATYARPHLPDGEPTPPQKINKIIKIPWFQGDRAPHPCHPGSGFPSKVPGHVIWWHIWKYHTSWNTTRKHGVVNMEQASGSNVRTQIPFSNSNTNPNKEGELVSFYFEYEYEFELARVTCCVCTCILV